MTRKLPIALAAIALVTAPLVAQKAAKPPAGPLGGDSAGSATKSVLPNDGKGLYQAVCQSCHMANGKGGTGAATIPALAGNPRLATTSYPIVMVAQGRGAMPGFVDLMSPAQIAEVVRYVCTNFGNSCKGDTSPETVRKLIATVQHRPA